MICGMRKLFWGARVVVGSSYFRAPKMICGRRKSFWGACAVKTRWVASVDTFINRAINQAVAENDFWKVKIVPGRCRGNGYAGEYPKTLKRSELPNAIKSLTKRCQSQHRSAMEGWRASKSNFRISRTRGSVDKLLGG